MTTTVGLPSDVPEGFASVRGWVQDVRSTMFRDLSSAACVVQWGGEIDGNLEVTAEIHQSTVDLDEAGVTIVQRNGGDLPDLIASLSVPEARAFAEGLTAAADLAESAASS